MLYLTETCSVGCPPCTAIACWMHAGPRRIHLGEPSQSARKHTAVQGQAAGGRCQHQRISEDTEAHGALASFLSPAKGYSMISASALAFRR